MCGSVQHGALTYHITYAVTYQVMQYHAIMDPGMGDFEAEDVLAVFPEDHEGAPVLANKNIKATYNRKNDDTDLNGAPIEIDMSCQTNSWLCP